MVKKRIGEIEILRGIAFLAVVLQHAFAGIFYLPNITSDELTIGNTFLGLIRFAVPLFVFITGVVLFYNYDTILSYKSFIKKRIKQIIVPYVIWSIFYYIWVSFLLGFSSLSIPNEFFTITKKIIKAILTGEAEYHLWFMAMIIPFYFLFPLFRPLISKNNNDILNIIVVIVSFIINILLLYAFSNGIIESNNEVLNFFLYYLDRNFIIWIFYFLLGGLVGIYYNRWILFVNKTVVVMVPLLAVLMYYVYTEIAKLNTFINENSYYISSNVTSPLKPFTMILVIVLIIILFYIAQKIDNMQNLITKTLNVFGKYSFGSYLIHAFILRFTNAYVVNSLDYLNPYMQTVISFILCSVISLSICYFISRIKISVGEVIVGKV